MALKFIPEELVPAIHRTLLQRYGGTFGLRDHGLLASALAQPKITIGRRFVHRTVFDKASAYGYHLCANHPFVDGNTQVAFALMYLFLEQNGYEVEATEQDACQTMIALAARRMKKPALAAWLKAIARHTSRQWQRHLTPWCCAAHEGGCDR
jgi:death-on-curing protein